MSGEQRARPRWFFVLVPALGVAGGLLAAEALTRALQIAPPVKRDYGANISDPWLPFRKEPLSVTRETAATGEFTYEYRHNSAGLRDVEHSVSNRDAFRILGLGDSFTYGIGAPFEATYLAQLETHLNQRPGRHGNIEIIKAGIPRFFPEAERILLERYGRQYSPNLILIGFLPNDVLDSSLGLDGVSVGPSGFLRSRQGQRLGAFGEVLYENSALARIVLPRLAMLAEHGSLRSGSIYKGGGTHEKDWRTVEREYARIVAIANEIRAKVVVVNVPQHGPWPPERSYPGRRLGAWAAAHGAGFVDVLPAMIEAEKTGGPLYYPKDGHCTPRGYGVIARAIEQYLVAHALAE